MNYAAVSLSNQFENRLIEFGIRVVQLAQTLPKTPECRHFKLQILRSGTAAAPNYAEARGAESRADFIHKMGIVQKELNETSVWLRMLKRIVAEKSEKISEIIAENTELARIVTASIKTAQSRMKSPGNEQ
jgi:four helix bundle protein